jgi:16S rRNA (cytidine1402-2'-O)-methyltransferase
LIPTPIGNINDLSLRAIYVIAEGEIFLCEDTRVTKKLIAIVKKRFSDLPRLKFCENPEFFSVHSHNEQEFLESLNPEIFKKNCVYASDAGMPCVSDPGSKLVSFCQQNKIGYEVLPGANAAITAFAASGFEQTRFIFHGFLPHKREARKKEMSDALSQNLPIIFYESPHRIANFAELTLQIAPNAKIAAFKEMTKLHENRFFGDAAAFYNFLKTSNTKGEWTIAVFEAGAKSRNGEIVNDLLNLKAPIKPLSKILAKLTGEKSAVWYERLTRKN